MQTILPKKPAVSRTAKYVYALIDAGGDGPLGWSGIDDAPIHVIGARGIAAVVSDVPNVKLRPERKRLAAHHEVLKRLSQEHAVLPMTFGTVANGAAAVRGFLARNQDALAEQLRRVGGKMEMGLRVVWDVPNIFEFMVATHPELRTIRDCLFRTGHESSREEKIELGQAFERIRAGARAAHIVKVASILRPCCAEIKENKLRGEREVMNLACLIRREDQKSFEQGVFEAAQYFDNHFSFDMNGPWPPHNFVALDWQG